MVPLPAWAMVEVVPSAFSLVVVAISAYLGLRSGLFLSVVAALAVITAFSGALGLAPRLGAYFSSLHWMPVLVLPLAYFLILAFVLLATKAVTAACLRDDDAWLSPRFDRFGGGLMGAFAGWLLAGSLLVGWSMIELPAGVRPPMPSRTHDAGSWMLKMLARMNGNEKVTEGGGGLLNGDTIHGKSGGGRIDISATEPFDDVNENGRWDEHEGKPERFIDHDANGDFTKSQEVTNDVNKDQSIRDVGLLDRYWLSAWRRIRVMHPPKITSKLVDVLQKKAEKDALIYTAEVKDADPDHESRVKYSLKKDQEDDSGLLTIDPSSGEVRFLNNIDIDEKKARVRFTLIVEDPSGLTDQGEVEVTLKPPQKQAESARP